MKKINFTLSLFLIMLAGLTQAQELSQEKSFNDSLVIYTKDTLQKNQFILGLQTSGTSLDGSFSISPSTGIQFGYRLRNKHSILLTLNPGNNAVGHSFDLRYQYDFFQSKRFYFGAYAGLNYRYINKNHTGSGNNYFRYGLNFGFTASYNLPKNFVLKSSLGHEWLLYNHYMHIDQDNIGEFYQFEILPKFELGIEKRF